MRKKRWVLILFVLVFCSCSVSPSTENSPQNKPVQPQQNSTDSIVAATSTKPSPTHTPDPTQTHTTAPTSTPTITPTPTVAPPVVEGDLPAGAIAYLGNGGFGARSSAFYYLHFSENGHFLAHKPFEDDCFYLRSFYGSGEPQKICPDINPESNYSFRFFDPDGRYMIYDIRNSEKKEYEVVVIDVESQQAISSFPDYSSVYWGDWFIDENDCGLVLIGEKEGDVYPVTVWNPVQDVIISEFKLSAPEGFYIKGSSDGKFLLVDDDYNNRDPNPGFSNLQVFDTRTGELLFKIQHSPWTIPTYHGFYFASDSETLIFKNNEHIKSYSLPSGETIADFYVEGRLRFISDEKMIITAHENYPVLYYYDYQTGVNVQTLTLASAPDGYRNSGGNGIFISNDGTYSVSTTCLYSDMQENMILVHDLTTGEIVHEYKFHGFDDRTPILFENGTMVTPLTFEWAFLLWNVAP